MKKVLSESQYGKINNQLYNNLMINLDYKLYNEYNISSVKLNERLCVPLRLQSYNTHNPIFTTINEFLFKGRIYYVTKFYRRN